MGTSYDLGDVAWFTVGTVGVPGARTFYLQAQAQVGILSLKVEKEQAAALAAYLMRLLDDLPQQPDDPPAHAPELDEPVLPEWTVWSIAVGYDTESDRLVLLAEELVPTDDDDDEPALLEEPATLRLRLTRAQARAYVERAGPVIHGGRPRCDLCHQPMNPDGHVCVRTNGHKPH